MLSIACLNLPKLGSVMFIPVRMDLVDLATEFLFLFSFFGRWCRKYLCARCNYFIAFKGLCAYFHKRATSVAFFNVHVPCLGQKPNVNFQNIHSSHFPPFTLIFNSPLSFILTMYHYFLSIMTSLELDRWLGSTLVGPCRIHSASKTPLPFISRSPILCSHHLSTFRLVPRGLCSLPQEYTYSIIYGFIFHLNTRTVLLPWDALYMIYPPRVSPCATSRTAAALLCGGASAICIQCVVKSWRNLTATLAARRACQIEVDMVLPCEDASFRCNAEISGRCGFFPPPFLSSPARMCVLSCVWVQAMCACVSGETRRGQTVALRISFKQTLSCQAFPLLSEGSVKQNISPLLYNHMSCFLAACHVQPFSVNYLPCAVLAVGMCTRQE